MADDGSYVSDLRGLSKILIDATTGVTDIVEKMHHTIKSTAMPMGKAPEGRTRGVTGFVYDAVRTVTGAVGSGIDLVLDRLAPLVDQQPDARKRVYLQGVLNAVVGDYLETTKNPLALSMRLCRGGTALTLNTGDLAGQLPDATGKVVLFVHGLGMNDQWWQGLEPDYGTCLAAGLGYTSLYLRYNTGRHVSLNGKQLAAQLDALVANWPVPVEQLSLVGYSMGGLVVRSAVHYARAHPGGFREKLRHMVFLGVPHHGAPLERGGNWVDFVGGISPYSAPILRIARIRSSGITDLRHGSLLDSDWLDGDRFERTGDVRTPVPLPEGVRCHALAGRISPSAVPGAGAILGDGLVPVASALGRHRDPARALGFGDSDVRVVEGLDHIRMLNHPDVQQALLDWLHD